MSTTYGPPVVLDGPLPSPLPFGLLAAATLVPEADERWGNGASIYGYPADLPSTFDPCSAGTFRIKDEAGAIPAPRFGAYGVYLTETCTARGIGDEAAFARRAELALSGVEQWAVEHEFALGLAVPSNPFLTDGDADSLAAGAVGPAESLALLEKAIGGSGKAGMIHAGRDTVSAWSSLGSLRVVGDKLVTFLGTPVAAGGGYQGASEGGAPGADQGYAWATGPVQVRRSEIYLVPGSLSEALDREQNVVTYRAERNYLVDWDTQLQAAVLVDRSL